MESFCLIFKIFVRGEILNLYLAISTSSEYKFALKVSKFSLSKFDIFDLLNEMSNNFCFKHEHISVS